MVAAPGAAEASVYRCEKDGAVIFSDYPCGDDATKLRPLVVVPPPPEANGPRSGLPQQTPSAQQPEPTIDSQPQRERRQPKADVRVEHWKSKTSYVNWADNSRPNGKYFIVDGELKNHGEARAERVTVTVEALSFFGELQDIATAPAKPFDMPVRNQAEFQVAIPHTRDIRKFTVSVSWD